MCRAEPVEKAGERGSAGRATLIGVCGAVGWMVENGYGEASRRRIRRSRGRHGGRTDPTGSVRSCAWSEDLPQLGTLGSGNHFLEVQYVEEIHDQRRQAPCALTTGASGRPDSFRVPRPRASGLHRLRGADEQGDAEHKITLPYWQLACAPHARPERRTYLGAMTAAANFAWANRQGILHFLRGAFRRLFGDGTRLEPGLRRLSQHCEARDVCRWTA